MRTRVSLKKEDRIYDLWKQGYPTSSIAPIVNTSTCSVNRALRRVARRWKYPDDPRKGRLRGFLSDSEIEEIRMLYERNNFSVADIARLFQLTFATIYGIVKYNNYIKSEDGYPFDFSTRPNQRRL